MNNLTPAQLAYRMPAEWEAHRATWLTWPRPQGISFPERFEVVPPVYAEIIRQLASFEDVEINVFDDEIEEQARRTLLDHRVPLDRVHFHKFPAYEPWCRDHGPIFLVRNQGGVHERAVADFGYNAWGGKYPPYDLDDAIPQHVAKFRDLPLFSPTMILEGGSIDVNGRGTLITTESCLLNSNRNPDLSQKDIAQCLRDYLGVTKILWLGEGIVGDDTDGHIDDLTRFINATTVVTVVEDNPDDANYQLLQDNLQRLRSFRDQDDHLLRVVKLPMPSLVEFQGQRLPASYANFYIANEIVLVPTFRRPTDTQAVSVLQKEFPNRRVLPIDSSELIWGLGAVHCLTQQEPA